MIKRFLKKNIFLIVVISVLIISGCMTFISDNKVEQVIKNFDYSSIQQVEGTVLSVKTFNDKLQLNLNLANGTQVIANGGDELTCSIGDVISVYTDGKHYSIFMLDMIQSSAKFIFWSIVKLIASTFFITSIGSMMILVGLGITESLKNVKRRTYATVQEREP